VTAACSSFDGAGVPGPRRSCHGGARRAPCAWRFVRAPRPTRPRSRRAPSRRRGLQAGQDRARGSLKSTVSIESYQDFGSDGCELLARCAGGAVSEPTGGRTPASASPTRLSPSLRPPRQRPQAAASRHSRITPGAPLEPCPLPRPMAPHWPAISLPDTGWTCTAMSRPFEDSKCPEPAGTRMRNERALLMSRTCCSVTRVRTPGHWPHPSREGEPRLCIESRTCARRC